MRASVAGSVLELYVMSGSWVLLDLANRGAKSSDSMTIAASCHSHMQVQGRP